MPKHPLATSILASAITLLMVMGILLAEPASQCPQDQTKFLNCLHQGLIQKWTPSKTSPIILPQIISQAPAVPSQTQAEKIANFTNIDALVDPSGTILLFGRVGEGEKVELFANGRFFARTTADEVGRWEHIPKPSITDGGVEVSLKTYDAIRPSTLLDQSVIIITSKTDSQPPIIQITSPHLGAELLSKLRQDFAQIKPAQPVKLIPLHTPQFPDFILPRTMIDDTTPPVPQITLLQLIKVDEHPEVSFSSGKIIIQDGDNLWSISNRLYGAGNHYTEIFDVNKDQISHPNWIFPGQVLKLPEKITLDEAPHQHQNPAFQKKNQ